MSEQPPAHTLQAVLDAPPGSTMLLLVRHADRGPIPPGDPGNDLPLLPEGVERARALGRVIGGRLGLLRSSPVPRCAQTAAAIAAGAAQSPAIVLDTHLGDPGVYVEQGGAGLGAWQAIGHERVVEHIIAGVRLPGLADPLPASRRLYEHLVTTAGGAPGVHVYVTHDLLVAAAAAHWLGVPLTRADWPVFLEALVLGVDDDGATASYRRWSRPAWGSRTPSEESGG
ncbi:MAG: histidine phosphatase family protein [Deltaproteobacteria bacterium]|nr:histidine phosphatase family protein [Deltaproteobacteria bacterium]